MTLSIKDLQALNKDIKALEKKMEKLIAAVEKSETIKAAKKPAAKPIKAQTTKRAPAKKSPARKKPAQPTATDQVLNIIKIHSNRPFIIAESFPEITIINGAANYLNG